MIKKIRVDQLEPGMYVQDLDVGWMRHPFLRSSFKLESPADLAKIRKAGIRELYIDTDRGRDLPQAPGAAEARTKSALQFERAPANPRDMPRRSLSEERGKAEEVRSEATRVVDQLMRDARAGRQIEVKLATPVTEKMVDSLFRNQDALLGLTRIRRMDQYTFEHSVSVAALLITFAKHQGMPRDTLVEIGIGGLLHDIGKTRTPEHILNKPGKLDDDEWPLMQHHVVDSRLILEDTPGIPPTSLVIAAQHHERFDGSGYPLGLKGDEISLYGQMAAIVDVYDAITADRVYRKGVAPRDVLHSLLEWSRDQFNPVLVHQYVQSVGIYPVGSLVSLASGRIALVRETGRKGLLYPIVRVIYDSDKRRFLIPRDLDLSDLPEGSDERIVGSELPGAWGIRPEVYMD